MRHPPPAFLFFAAALAAACNGPAAPARPSIYSYADTVAGTPLVFHWPADRLPVRYYARPEGSLPERTRVAIAQWEAQFLYGEFSGVLVSDSNDADVVIAFESGPPPPGEADTTSTVTACQGVTSPVLDASNRLERPLRVTLQWFSGHTPEIIAACLNRLVSHEVGHTLGLFNEAHAGADVTELMNEFPRVYGPAARDRATVEVLYHTTPTISPPPR
jgi:predicted Zn-dependent protease